MPVSNELDTDITCLAGGAHVNYAITYPDDSPLYCIDNGLTVRRSDFLDRYDSTPEWWPCPVE